MLVVMKTNLGMRDAAKFELDFKDCTSGSQLNVNDDAAEWLIARGFADFAGGKQESIEAIPAAPVVAEPQETIKGVTKDAKGKK